MVTAVAARRRFQQRAEVSEFEADVLEGLNAIPKHVLAKYFYDAAGSRLFERITELPEYYPTRCEIRILRRHAARSEEHTSELQSLRHLVCRLLLEKIKMTVPNLVSKEIRRFPDRCLWVLMERL